MANSASTESAPADTAVAPAEPASAVSGVRPPDGNNLIATAPASVRLLYNLTGQARKMDYNVRGEVLWQQDGQRYAIRLYVSAFLIGSRSQTSEGDITPQGLAPRRYADKWRGEQAAHFNRETQRITFSANTPDAPLLPGAQDRLSLFIQTRRADGRPARSVGARQQPHTADRQHARCRVLGDHFRKARSD